MAVWTIARLTVREAVRRRILASVIIIGVMILCLTLLLLLIRADMERVVASGQQSRLWMAIEFPVRRSMITSLSLASIRIMASLLAVFISVGLLPADVEDGGMALFVSRGVSRRQTYVGRWLGLMCIVGSAALMWGVAVFVSLSLQSRTTLWPLLVAAPYLALFPILIGSAGLALSGSLPRFQALAWTLGISATAWMDGIFNGIGDLYNVSWLHRLAAMAALLMPQGTVAHWIQRAIEEINYTEPALSIKPVSPEPVRELGLAHGIGHLDAVYVCIYIVSLVAVGAAALQRRDV